MCTFRNEMVERERLPTGTKHYNAVSHRTILPASCEALWFFQKDARWYCGRVWSGLAAQMSEAVELPLLPPPLVTLTETSPCKGLSTLAALDIFREAFLILQYFFVTNSGYVSNELYSLWNRMSLYYSSSDILWLYYSACHLEYQNT